MKSEVLSAARLEERQGRIPAVNMISARFYLPFPTFPLYPYTPHFGAGFVSPEMYQVHRSKDTVQSADMSQCYHPVFQGMPYHRTIEEKPTQSYIGLIGKAILSSPQQKLILSDIYNYILSHYPYFRTKGPGWRNSIRHNLSLNDCFVKVGRSPHGKGHFWAINPNNYDEFSRGDYKRKRMSRRTVRESLAAGDGTKEEGAKKTAEYTNQKTARNEDKMKTKKELSNCSSSKVSCDTVFNTNGTEQRGFHIETLLSNKWEEAKMNETHNTTSAYVVSYSDFPGTIKELIMKL